ncbi:MAG: molybdopterin converting factor subunit 1 [Hyphomicrobiales bacterium]|nr:MAG: molybdopterin converting factor subunit 1 [Hyphomicrobiales bacterium]
MKICYFAWVREKVGRSEDVLDVPGHVVTVGDLMQWLKTQGAEYEAAFAQAKVIRAALDRAHVKHDAAIGSAREVAFFPPVTGG